MLILLPSLGYGHQRDLMASLILCRMKISFLRVVSFFLSSFLPSFPHQHVQARNRSRGSVTNLFFLKEKKKKKIPETKKKNCRVLQEAGSGSGWPAWYMVLQCRELFFFSLSFSFSFFFAFKTSNILV